MTTTTKVLFVLTGHDTLGDTGEPTGFHLAEAARPWRILTAAGIDVQLATPDGGKAPVDPGSCDLDDDDNAAFMNDAQVAEALADTPALASLDVTQYDALYFPGGHGTMWDLPDHDAVQHAARDAWESGKVVAAVCHGPAALVNVRLADGRWLVAGKTVSTFTDEEERAAEKDDIVPFLLASKLVERGAKHRKAGNFEACVSVDGRLVTGQNPASAAGVGEAIRDLLRKRPADAA